VSKPIPEFRLDGFRGCSDLLNGSRLIYANVTTAATGFALPACTAVGPGAHLSFRTQREPNTGGNLKA